MQGGRSPAACEMYHVVLMIEWANLDECFPFELQYLSVLIASCVIAGGFGSYLLGLNKKTYEQVVVDIEGNIPGSYKEPGIGWMTSFLFTVSFVGLSALVPLRKVLVFSLSSGPLFFVVCCLIFLALQNYCTS